MNFYSVPVLMMSAVCIYASFYYFIMFALRGREREYLTFALACLSVFIYDITCAGLYNATNIEQGIFWQKGNFIGTSLISISLIWFISDFTKARIGKRATALTCYFLLMIPVIALMQNGLTLTADNPSVKHIVLGQLLDVTYQEARPGILYSILMLVSIIAFIYLIFILIRYNRSNPNRKAFKIIASFCLFFAGVSNDILVSSGFYNFIYVSEYVFMYIIITMGYMLQTKFIKFQEEVENQNVTLELTVAERTKELKEARDALWGEMQLAEKIQTVLLPSSPHVRGYEIAAYMKPAEMVGGDYYDIVSTDENDWVIIGDVSGHGVAAGLVTMMVQSIVQAKIRENPSIMPHDLLSFVNEAMKYNISKMFESKFMTVMAFSFFKDGKVSYSGRHDSPIVYRRVNREIEFLKSEGILFSTLHSVCSAISCNMRLDTGDVLILYTDGITEALDANGNMFSEKRLAQLLEDYGELPPDAIKTQILENMKDFVINDDITLVILKRK
jgi:serine phosphatase RsbU (regulator of sigma subunit)